MVVTPLFVVDSPVCDEPDIASAKASSLLAFLAAGGGACEPSSLTDDAFSDDECEGVEEEKIDVKPAFQHPLPLLAGVAALETAYEARKWRTVLSEVRVHAKPDVDAEAIDIICKDDEVTA